MLRDRNTGKIIDYSYVSTDVLDICEKSERLYGYSLLKDRMFDDSVGNGRTRRYDKVFVVYMGGMSRLPLVPASETKYALAVLSAYHEREHMHQYEELMYGDDEEGHILAEACYAGDTNRCFAGLIYPMDPHELMAERQAIVSSFNHFSRMFDEDTANRLVCKAVNYRISTKSEFISFNSKHKKYENLDDILDAFDLQYERNFKKTIEYNIPLGREAGDELAMYLSLACNKGYLEILNSADDLRTQMRMSAYAHYMLSGEEERKALPEHIVSLGRTNPFEPDLFDYGEDDDIEDEWEENEEDDEDYEFS